MSQVFDSYARYYDLLYRDKDYIAEVEYVSAHIKRNTPKASRILELGCGTGAHAEIFARLGYTVHGVDMSQQMLNRAEQRKSALATDVAARLSFSRGDVRSVRTEDTYDTVISLFHVMSYQSTNADVIAAFETAATHLVTGGLFLFDFWYGPAVLTQQPDTRVKRLQNSKVNITRIAEPEILLEQNLVDVNYTVYIEDKDINVIEHFNETHRMRYFFLPELPSLHDDSWQELISEEWLSGNCLGPNTWSAVQLLRRN